MVINLAWVWKKGMWISSWEREKSLSSDSSVTRWREVRPKGKRPTRLTPICLSWVLAVSHLEVTVYSQTSWADTHWEVVPCKCSILTMQIWKTFISTSIWFSSPYWVPRRQNLPATIAFSQALWLVLAKGFLNWSDFWNEIVKIPTVFTRVSFPSSTVGLVLRG